ncbi:FAD-dependent oxidoreductase [Oricola sp.]|uniref:NAD(P)/FAD-dependent oxidoreductase n=1 Tax=Oricola sp. TaxID=1979950 RepID=UPI0025CE3FEC|nr:FAD-dependent oxidoreductase [Oricola sp.]MCI5076611.1 FAD-binding oxidoreductase [Oricola sp.]
MTEKTDILVIGGGITGQSAALAAADAGARVTIVDAARNAGSTANAGSLHVQMQSRFLRLNPHLADNLESSLPLYVRAVTAWEELDQRLGGVELVRQGGLMLAETAEQAAFLEQKAEREIRKGLDVEILDRDALFRHAPYLSERFVAAELCHNEGKLNPLVANRKMTAELDRLGVSRHVDRIVQIGEENGKAVAQGAERFVADRIIIAAAWGSGELARPLGLTIPTPGEPLHMNITEPAEYVIHHLIQHAERSITLKQFASGQVVIGGGWPATLDRDDALPAIKPQSLTGNVALAGEIVPAVVGLRLLRTWAGVNTPVDGKATLGPIKAGGLIHFALPGDAGYTLGPIVGRCAAASAMGTTPPMDIAPFTPDRFAA